jgi:hypothetical protein
MQELALSVHPKPSQALPERLWGGVLGLYLVRVPPPGLHGSGHSRAGGDRRHIWAATGKGYKGGADGAGAGRLQKAGSRLQRKIGGRVTRRQYATLKRKRLRFFGKLGQQIT